MAEKANPSEMVLYTTEDGTVKVDTVSKDETLWLTQKKMAELFQVKTQNITIHLKNIYAEGELSEEEINLINTPVLIVKTDNEYFVPVDVFNKMAELMKASRVLHIPEGSHSVYREKSVEISKEICSFNNGSYAMQV